MSDPLYHPPWFRAGRRITHRNSRGYFTGIRCGEYTRDVRCKRCGRPVNVDDEGAENKPEIVCLECQENGEY